MKRSKKLIALSQDHHHGLKLAQLIKKDTPDYDNLPSDTEGKVRHTLEAWENELKIHFQNEEEVLFPAVKGKDRQIDHLIDSIMVEHKGIKSLVDSLPAAEDKAETLDTLGQLLERHIRKEERELFDRIQKVFSEDELQELVDKIEPVK